MIRAARLAACLFRIGFLKENRNWCAYLSLFFCCLHKSPCEFRGARARSIVHKSDLEMRGNNGSRINHRWAFFFLLSHKEPLMINFSIPSVRYIQQLASWRSIAPRSTCSIASYFLDSRILMETKVWQPAHSISCITSPRYSNVRSTGCSQNIARSNSQEKNPGLCPERISTM